MVRAGYAARVLYSGCRQKVRTAYEVGYPGLCCHILGGGLLPVGGWSRKILFSHPSQGGELMVTKTWAEARDCYWYANMGRGKTLKFQDSFRSRAGNDIDAWFEVANRKSPRSAGKTILHIRKTGTTAAELFNLCETYMESPSLKTFSQFRRRLAKTDVIATAATFPAFLRPDQFPMVDTQITRWVTGESLDWHSQRAGCEK